MRAPRHGKAPLPPRLVPVAGFRPQELALDLARCRHDTYLKYAASTPKLDPAVLVPYLAQATKHLGLVPALQRRGLTRKAYAHKTLRENLLEF